MIIIQVLEDARFAGPQAWALQTARYLKDTSNIKSYIIFPKRNSTELANRLNSENIPFKSFSLHGLGKGKLKIARYLITFLPELLQLSIFIKKIKADIVHCHNVWQFKAAIAGKLVGAKVVWHIHETWMPGSVRMLFTFFASLCADGFVTAGKQARTHHIGMGKLSYKPIICLQSPVNTNKFNPEIVAPDQKIDAYTGVKIVTVGNINLFKGLEYYIKMAHILEKNYNDIHFFIVGPVFETQRDYMKTLFDLVYTLDLKNMHFMGSSNNIPSVLKAADIYVCSSIYEASPTVVWEAMAMAKAIVTTDVGDVAKIIDNDFNGNVVPSKNPVQLACQVSRLIKSYSLRMRWGECARRTAVENIDAKKCMARQVDFYSQISNKEI